MKKEAPTIIENEPDVITTHGTFKQSQLKNVVINEEKPGKKKVQYCPLRRRPCEHSCALWTGIGCKLYTGGMMHAGGVCPVSGQRCGETCAMYQNSKKCALFKG